MKGNCLPNSSYPRERLLEYGATALSDQELLAIMLRTGTKKRNVLELSGYILQKLDSLYDLKHLTIAEWQEIDGVGKIKALELQAMIELGTRIHRAARPKHGQISSSVDVAQYLMDEMKDYQQEHLLCLYLNTKNEIIQKKTLFIGSLNQAIAHPREIYQWAVRCSAARTIVAHNHRETRS